MNTGAQRAAEQPHSTRQHRRPSFEPFDPEDGSTVVRQVLHIRRRRLVMRPTRYVLWMAFVAVAMFVGAINYNSNPAWFLVFAMLGAALVSALHARRNLAAIDVVTVQPPRAFAGEVVPLAIAVRNTSDREVLAIEISAPCGFDAGTEICERFEPGQGVNCQVAFAPRSRGPFTITRVRLSTIYPLGLWRVWRDYTFSLEGIVYPQPAGLGPDRVPPADPGALETGPGAGTDDFHGHRRYQVGDSQRHVDWKAYARGRDLLVKEYHGGGAGLLWLEWDSLVGDLEGRVSQLTRWVVEAQRAGLRYGLRLPGFSREPDHGAEHYHICLQALACHGLRDAGR